MRFKDLAQFIDTLDQKNELQHIRVTVDSELEITEIADRVSKAYGKALLFHRVKNSPYPLAINLMGTYERLALGLGVSNLEEIATEIEDYLNLSAYVTLTGKIKSIPKLAPLPFIFPKKVKRAPCQEVIEEPNLNTLPILKCWPEDGGKYITLPLVFTKDPETGQQNVGMYRLQVYDEKTTGMHWHLHKDGREIYEKYRKLGRKMPVSVAIGCDPTIIYAATAPLPKMIDEMIFAGYLKKRPIEVVQCVSNELYVPAHSEFVLEGYVDLDERRLEGPFGDHTGYYSLSDLYPVFHIEKITRKKSPIYPTTIVGKPPMEDCYLGKATERIFLPLMKIQCPEMVDMDFPLEGVFHNCAIVSIKKAFPKHAQKALYSLWGLGQMMYTKMIIVVDDSVNVHDYNAVANAVVSNLRHPSDLILTEGPLDALDHASNRAFQGFRLGVDATSKLPNESHEGVTSTVQSDSIKNWTSFFSVICVDKTKESGLHALQQFETACDFETLKLCIAIDNNIDSRSLSTVAWKVFNNIDPNRDLVISHSKNRLFIGIDATKKSDSDGLTRPWPNDIEMSDDIKQLVSERWADYGFKK